MPTRAEQHAGCFVTGSSCGRGLEGQPNGQSQPVTADCSLYALPMPEDQHDEATSDMGEALRHNQGRRLSIAALGLVVVFLVARV